MWPDLFGSSRSASLGPNSLSDMGGMSLLDLQGIGAGSALPKFDTGGLQTNGINFDSATRSGMAGGLGSSLANSGLGFNVGTGQLLMSGLGSLGQLWTGMQAAGLAKDQFNFTKKNTEMNTRNQTQLLNSQIEDRYRNRAIVEGRSTDDDLARARLRV